MRIVKTLAGSPFYLLLAVGLLPTCIILWIPTSFFGQLSLYIPIFCIALSGIAWFSCRVLSKPRIVASYDDFSICTQDRSINFDSVELIKLIDSGRLSGWKLELSGQSQTLSLPLSHVDNYRQMLDFVTLNAETAKIKNKTIIFGSVPEWIVALEISIILTGITRIVLQAYA